MSSDDSNSSLVREVEEFTRKVEAATQLTRSGFWREAKRINDIAFFQPVGGKTTSIKRAQALSGYLDTLLDRVRQQIRDHFKPIAQIARRYSPSDMLLAFVLDAPHFITACENEHQDWLGGMCNYYGRPNEAASFRETYRRVFIEDWNCLVWEAELAAEAVAVAPPDELAQPLPVRKIRKRRSRSKAEIIPVLVTDAGTMAGPEVVEAMPRRSSPQRSSAREPDQRKQLIASIKTGGEHKVEKIVVLIDQEIEKIPPRSRWKCAPLDEWRLLAPECRSWVEFLAHSGTHKRVRNYVNKIKPLPSGITKKRA